ncbi:MAG: hypothetical protein EOM45_03585 [Clostridia bacterium]|nr:hypothetical protein [Clostridia bacterium]
MLGYGPSRREAVEFALNNPYIKKRDMEFVELALDGNPHIASPMKAYHCIEISFKDYMYYKEKGALVDRLVQYA